MIDLYNNNALNRNQVLDKIDELQYRLEEEVSKSEEERDRQKEFELLYAKMIAGLKLNTGYRLF